MSKMYYVLRIDSPSTFSGLEELEVMIKEIEEKYGAEIMTLQKYQHYQKLIKEACKEKEGGE